MDTMGTETFGKLWEIMRRNKEVEKAYDNAAKSEENKKLGDYFRRKSNQWKKFGDSLKIKVMAAFPSGVGPKEEMAIMEIPSLDNGATTIKKFSQRERAEVEEYRKILEEQKLPFEIYQIIRKHKMWIEVDLAKSMLGPV